MPHDSTSNWNLTLTVSGLGLTLASLYLLRRSRTKKWIDLGRLQHLNAKSLQGQTVVITGANTGLGYEAATEFSRRGASTVILACRDVTRGAEAAERIRNATGNLNVECIKLNLASLSSVREFADVVKSKYENIDLLVCNAGVWIPMDRSLKTEDGFEIHFGVNHLGHFLLTNLLLDKLIASQFGGRVVVVSSGLMNSGKINMEAQDFVYQGRKDESNSDGPKKRSMAPNGYSDTKLMNGLFVKTLAHKFPSEIQAYAVCPGWCKTELARYLNMSFFKKLIILPIAFLFMRSAAQGSHNIAYLGLEDKDKLVNGGFYRDGKIEEKENSKLDSMSDVGDELWKLSEKLSGLK